MIEDIVEVSHSFHFDHLSFDLIDLTNQDNSRVKRKLNTIFSN